MTHHETDLDDLRAFLDKGEDYASVPDCVSDFWIHGMDEHKEVKCTPTKAVSLINIVEDGQVSTIESAQAIFEAEKMLLSTFANCIPCPTANTKQGLKELLSVIYDETNYEIKKITKVYNPCIEYMHESFRMCYDIQNEKQVYHGTTFESAENIIHGGFRGVGCRSKFGKGIYSSTSVWECLLYANPSLENDWEQTFVVANLLVGPSAVGKQDMVNFGKDKQGQQILTLTDEKGQIFCASKDDQLAVKYQITVKYDFMKPRTDAKIQKVMYLHPFISKNLKVQVKIAQNKVIYEDTKKWINAFFKKKSDEKKVLQILHIDKNELDVWFKSGEKMIQTTAKLRQRIKKHLDESNNSSASNKTSDMNSQLGKRKSST